MRHEMLEVIDESGRVIRLAPRREIHGNPSLLHRVSHVLVFDSGGRLLLQRRSMTKDVAPGRWDTSVGGHVDPGETPEAAARREMSEELGIGPEIEFLYTYTHSNPYETELVHTYRAAYEGEVRFNPEEIDEVRHWGLGEIEAALGTGVLSDNFEHEFSTFTKAR